MPKVSRVFIKTGMIHLAVALLLGAVEAAARGGLVDARLMAIWPSYLHVLFIGWLMHLVIGVAHWMFPVSRVGPRRGREGIMIASYVALNVGLIARTVVEPSTQWVAPWVRQVGMSGSAIALWLGGLLFVVNTWHRIR
jgi:hypothetical protein